MEFSIYLDAAEDRGRRDAIAQTSLLENKYTHRDGEFSAAVDFIALLHGRQHGL
jgi:hypothetical protein